MPLTPYTHDEPITGEPHYLVKTPNPEFNGKRLQVNFANGVGRTRSRKKAQIMDEQFGYTVTMPTGAAPWEIDREDIYASRAEPFAREDGFAVVEELEID